MEELKDSIVNLIEDKKIDELKSMLNEVDMLQLLNAFQELDAADSVIVFRLLSKERSLDLFELLETSSQEELFQSFTEERAHEIIEWLEPDDRVRLLDELPAAVAKRMLIKLSHADREQTNLLMGYESGTAGRIMTPNFISLQRSKTAAIALEKVKRLANEIESIHTLYVINGKRIFEGVLSLRELLVADPNQTVEELMRTDIISVTTNTDQEEVAKTLQRLGLMSIPVVDKENQLVGIITFDDVADVIEEETTQDIEKMGAIIPSRTPYLETSVLRHSRNRIVWLLFLMVSAMLTGGVISHFEGMLVGIPILMAFVPLLMNTSGNAGAQTSTLVIRGMAVGEITLKSVLKVWWKEVRVAVICGITLGIVNFCRIIIFNGTSSQVLTVGLVVTLTICVTTVLAKSIGCLLPMIAKKLKIDPAIMASPLIATICDTLTLLTYFGFATILLGAYL